MFVARIVKCLNELIRSKVFVVSIASCLNELIGARCLL